MSYKISYHVLIYLRRGPKITLGNHLSSKATFHSKNIISFILLFYFQYMLKLVKPLAHHLSYSKNNINKEEL